MGRVWTVLTVSVVDDTEGRVLFTLCWGCESGTPTEESSLVSGQSWRDDSPGPRVQHQSCPPRDTFADQHQDTQAKRLQTPFLKTVPKCKQPKCPLTIKDWQSPSVGYCDGEIEYTLHTIIWVNRRKGLNTRNKTQKCNMVPHRFF